MYKAGELSSLLRLASNASLILFFMLRSTPETALGEVYIGPVPLVLFVFFLGIGFEFINGVLFRADLFQQKAFIAIFIVFLLTFASGVYQQNGMRYIAIDSICMASLLFGTLWSNSRSRMYICSFMRHWVMLPIFVLSVLTLIGTFLGFISPAGQSTRLYTYSQFDATFLLCALTPLCCANARIDALRSPLSYWVSFLPVCLAIVISMSTASRTGIVCCMVTLISLSSMMFYGRVRIGLAWAFAIFCLALTFFDKLPAIDSQLLNRVASTSITDEGRFTEVALMLEDLEGSELIGKGMGSRFATNIDFADPYALAPHIGLLALLHKAGAPIFVFLFLVPFAMCIYLATLSVFKDQWKTGEYRLRGCFAWSTVICGVQMSLSSGWDTLHLTLVSICFVGATGFVRQAKQTVQPKQRSHKNLVIKESQRQISRPSINEGTEVPMPVGKVGG